MGVSDHTDHNSLPHLLARPDVQRDRRLNHPQACGGVVREDQEHLTQCEAYKYLRGEPGGAGGVLHESDEQEKRE